MFTQVPRNRPTDPLLCFPTPNPDVGCKTVSQTTLTLNLATVYFQIKDGCICLWRNWSLSMTAQTPLLWRLCVVSRVWNVDSDILERSKIVRLHLWPKYPPTPSPARLSRPSRAKARSSPRRRRRKANVRRKSVLISRTFPSQQRRTNPTLRRTPLSCCAAPAPPPKQPLWRHANHSCTGSRRCLVHRKRLLTGSLFATAACVRQSNWSNIICLLRAGAKVG